jgi:hypothetical protein
MSYTPGVTYRRLCFLIWSLSACASSSSKGSDSQALATSCVPPAYEACPAAVPSFAKDIAPIINQRCNNCHVAGVDGGPWPLDTWQNIKDWQDLLITDLHGCTMPPADAGTPFPADERDKVWAWLMCNAPNN